MMQPARWFFPRIAAVALAAWSLAACAPHVQQSKPALEEIATGEGADMVKEPEKGPEPVIRSAEQERHQCCQQCAAAVAKDKSGDAPDKIPCVDFTADLKEECLVHFRKNAMMASQAQECAAQPAPAAPAADSESASVP